MPRGTAYDIETLKVLNEKEVKKVSEETRQAVWTPNTGKRFRLTGLIVGASAETVLTLEDETTVFMSVLIPAKTSISIPLPASGYLSAAAGNKLNIKVLETTVKITGTFFGMEDVA